jgi:hypothetical protein
MKNPKIIKNKNWSFANSSCINCKNVNECIRCSMLNQPDRQILLALLGYKKKTTQAMIDGIMQHELHFKNLKELDEYGIKQFYSDLYTGKEIFIKEANVCSPTHGLRGHIDGLKIRYDLKSKIFYYEIQELKPKWNKGYIFQLIGYALILSDTYCMITYKKKIKKEHFITRRLYFAKPTVNINGKFIYYKLLNKEYNIPLVDNNIMHQVIKGLYPKLKKIRKFMKAGIFHLSELKECPWCNSNCEFYEICSKYPYTKAKQVYFGKKQMLRKSPAR